MRALAFSLPARWQTLLTERASCAWRTQAVEAVEAAVLELAGTAPAPPEPEGSRLLRMASGALRRAGGSIARQVRCSSGCQAQQGLGSVSPELAGSAGDLMLAVLRALDSQCC